MLKTKTIVCLAPIDWNFLRQRHQILMTLFAQAGWRVIFIENLNPSPRLDRSFLKKLVRRLFKILRVPRPDSQNLPPNVEVVTPLVFPFKNKLSDFLNKKICVKLLAWSLGRRGVKNPLVWTYLATSTVLRFIEEIKPEFLLYDCVFDAPIHPDAPSDIIVSESFLLSSSNLVLTDNHHLLKKCQGFNTNTHLIPPGVDYELFSRPPALDKKSYVGQIDSPRLCFFGGIDDFRLDFRLIEYIAQKMTLWNIILVGPLIKTDARKLRLKNIHFKDTIPYNELPAALQEMDVLILPYKIIPFSKSIFPAKIYECLATGKPIVATPLEELMLLETGLIKIGRTREEFLRQTETALHADTKDAANQRKKKAAENSWKSRFEIIQSYIE